MKRTPELATKWGRIFECQRRLCEDPQVIGAWFQLVKNTMNKYGVQPEDIYNFDKTGFQMGFISPSMVVTSSDRKGRPKQVKPTNTQWITVIQGACADGTAVPPFFIFKGKQLSQSWFQPGLPHDWTFHVSENGWSLDELGL